jgi:20S proteasome alpha/beta subunit
MTAIVGVICKDGVVVGSDSATTFTAGPQRTIEQPSKKIDLIKDCIISAGTGSVGLHQRFNSVIESNWGSYQDKNPFEITQQICISAISNFVATGLRSPFEFGALLAFYHHNNFHLCEFEIHNLQPEFKTEHLWYVSMGSGQFICDPVLGFVRRIFWDDMQPNLIDGIFGTVWALNQAIELNPGGVNGPIQLAILSDGGKAKILDVSECSEHIQHIKEFEDYLRSFKNVMFNNPKELPNLG